MGFDHTKKLTMSDSSSSKGESPEVQVLTEPIFARISCYTFQSSQLNDILYRYYLKLKHILIIVHINFRGRIHKRDQAQLKLIFGLT